jgi:response regulator receiver protein
MTYQIMIIDDNRPLADSLQKNVDWNSLNAEVTYLLYDALSVYQILKDEKIDLIISDIRMPGLSGLEMAKHILAEKYNTKIILISAYEDFQYVQEAIRIGAVDYIEKPINFEYLYCVIKKALSQIEENKLIQKQLEESKPAMKENLFRYLLEHSSTVNQHKYQQFPSYLSMNIDSNHHICLIIKTLNATEYKNELGFHYYLTQYFSFKNWILKCFEIFTLSNLLENDDSLILFLGKTVKNKNDLYKIVRSALSTMYQNTYSFKIYVGIGNPVNSFWNIGNSYENACLALDYRFFLPDECIFFWCDLPPKIFFPDINLDTKYNEILKLICKNQLSELKNYLDTLYQDYFSLNMNRTGLLLAISDIANRILCFLLNMGIQSDLLNQSTISYHKLERCKTSMELFEWLYDFCVFSCKELNSSVSYYQNRIVTMATSYINEHFPNPELSLNNIAEYINITPTYLSATFKKNTNKNISDLIAKTRIEHSIDLLKNSNFSIKEISEKSGFSNQYYFSSCFKKITGITPSQFRDT